LYRSLRLSDTAGFTTDLDERMGARGSVVVEALCYKPEDEVDFSNLPNPAGRTMALGSTQPLTEMNTRILKKKKKPGGKGRPARRADNLAAIF
jgi:hypothetical protein